MTLNEKYDLFYEKNTRTQTNILRTIRFIVFISGRLIVHDDIINHFHNRFNIFIGRHFNLRNIARNITSCGRLQQEADQSPNAFSHIR